MNSSRFKPAWWLQHAHAQTIWPNTLARATPPALRRERHEQDDGDFLDVFWNAVPAATDQALVVVLHGLEGSFRSAYAASLMEFLAHQGVAAVLLHFRNCGGVSNRLPRSYHSGETGDIRWLIKHLQQQGFTQLYAFGFSLGGNALLKYLAESGSCSTLQAAAAISVPMRLDICADRMNTGLSKVYQYDLLQRLRQSVRRKSVILEQSGFICPNLQSLKNFRQFDDRITAPLHGFSGAEEYYRLNSSRQFLGEIETPTLLLHAQDDPFMTAEVIPEAKELSRSVTLELSEHGGHVGFIDGGSPFRPRRWLNQRLLSWIQA